MNVCPRLARSIQLSLLFIRVNSCESVAKAAFLAGDDIDEKASALHPISLSPKIPVYPRQKNFSAGDERGLAGMKSKKQEIKKNNFSHG